MNRSLPSLEEAARILGAKRTRPPRRPPPAAGRAVTRAIEGLDVRFGQGVEGLAAHWTEVVGKALSARSEPGRLIKSRLKPGAILELRVEGPSSILIQHQAPDIVERVNLFLGDRGRDRVADRPASAPGQTEGRRRDPIGPASATAARRRWTPPTRVV